MSLATRALKRVEHVPSPVGVLSQRIRAEYAEMPGMRLTPRQFRRLWNLGERDAEAVVRELVSRDVLAEGPDGRIGRR